MNSDNLEEQQSISNKMPAKVKNKPYFRIKDIDNKNGIYLDETSYDGLHAGALTHEVEDTSINRRLTNS